MVFVTTGASGCGDGVLTTSEMRASLLDAGFDRTETLSDRWGRGMLGRVDDRTAVAIVAWGPNGNRSYDDFGLLLHREEGWRPLGLRGPATVESELVCDGKTWVAVARTEDAQPELLDDLARFVAATC